MAVSQIHLSSKWKVQSDGGGGGLVQASALYYRALQAGAAISPRWQGKDSGRWVAGKWFWTHTHTQIGSYTGRWKKKQDESWRTQTETDAYGNAGCTLMCTCTQRQWEKHMAECWKHTLYNGWNLFTISPKETRGNNPIISFCLCVNVCVCVRDREIEWKSS